MLGSLRLHCLGAPSAAAPGKTLPRASDVRQIGAFPDAATRLLCHDSRVRVLIVDDHADFRSSARALLAAEGYEVVGEAADGSSALLEAVRLRPAIVILDVQLPDVDGFIVAERLAATPDPPAVVLVSTRDESSYRRRLAETSARGFVPKAELSGASVAALVA